MPYQPGGTGTVLSNTMLPHVISIGNDKIGLGWWAWTRLQGKEKAVTITPSPSGV